MQLFSENKQYKLYQGNMLDMSTIIEPETIDSIVTDPPYELGFMGKSWDNSGIAFQKETWEKCLHALKPGGYLLAFGGSRTFHRIACAIEDAGFEIRDTIMWLYGSGFPKSINIGLAIDKKNGLESIDTGILSPNARPNSTKNNTLYESGTVGKEFTIKKATNQWDGWGSQLKPSFEPIIVARKPFSGSLTDNVLKYGVGALNIDECRISLLDGETKCGGFGHAKTGFQKGIGNSGDDDYKCTWIKDTQGRFPANTILTYDENDYNEVCGEFPNTSNDIADSASRYFYCSKASNRDRDMGLSIKNTHPTVKPTDLMQYLIKLVTPAGGTILDPFNGSGSTGKAVMYENNDHNKNYKYIGIELTEEYLPISKARIEYAIDDKSIIKQKISKPKPTNCGKSKKKLI